MNEKKPTANVLEIQRMSTEDGPGLRTTVFFKGCSLKCSWCHNPESISQKPQIQWIGSRCIACHSCLDICPNEGLSFNEEGLVLDREKCDSCGKCVEECPSTAMEQLGENWELDQLVHEVSKDKAYFEQSGGGVTVSGGEPGLQPQFIGRFLQELRKEGIQTAFDTCGLCSQTALDSILPYANIVLFDMKIIDPEKHLEHTGSRNNKILENIIYVADFIKEHLYPNTFWIRTPIIPGATDSIENIQAIGRFIAENLGDTVNRWELCSFNNLCKDKYFRLGMDWEFKDTELIKKETMENLADAARRSGVNPEIVLWTGSTRPEEPADEHAKQDSKKTNAPQQIKSYCQITRV
jgi:pyruvate formate lyase activating enzyme